MRAQRTVHWEEAEGNEDNAGLSDAEHDFDKEEETKDYIDNVTKSLAFFLLKTKDQNQTKWANYKSYSWQHRGCGW